MISKISTGAEIPSSKLNEMIDGINTAASTSVSASYAFTLSNLWVVNHTLKKRPTVTVIDTSNEIVVGVVSYISDSQLTISFSHAIAGTVYLN